MTKKEKEKKKKKSVDCKKESVKINSLYNKQNYTGVGRIPTWVTISKSPLSNVDSNNTLDYLCRK